MKTIVCHGDSLTEGAEVDQSDTWPALAEKELNIRIVNNGISGDTTGGLLSRFYHDVIQYRPGMVIIMAGTNDLWWDLSINVILANIFSMACQAQHHNIVPVIGLPLPMYTDAAQQQNMLEPIGGFKKCVEKMSKLVKALRDTAEKSDVAWMDFYHAFFDQQGNVLGKFFFEDGLHPNKDGHRRMAEITTRFLRSVL
jgi:lysophospholipase L1-like esterase